MKKQKTRMPCKLPKPSGYRSENGHQKIGKLRVIDTPAANSAPDFGPGGKHKGARY